LREIDMDEFLSVSEYIPISFTDLTFSKFTDETGKNRYWKSTASE